MNYGGPFAMSWRTWSLMNDPGGVGLLRMGRSGGKPVPISGFLEKAQRIVCPSAVGGWRRSSFNRCGRRFRIEGKLQFRRPYNIQSAADQTGRHGNRCERYRCERKLPHILSAKPGNVALLSPRCRSCRTDLECGSRRNACPSCGGTPQHRKQGQYS